MTTTTTSGAAIQRYKIGYHSDEWGQRSSTPSGIPDASGSWVRYADHVTALAAPSQSGLTDAYVGAREDLSIWKRRALEAERDLRSEKQTTSRLVGELNAASGPTFMGDPASDKCHHGDTHIVHDCLRCGAPVCCGKCCAAEATPHGQVPVVQGDALSDAVRVPLDSLHADAAYLIGRLREGSMPYARVIEIIRERIDAAKAAIRARAAHGQAPADLSPTAGMNIAQRILHVGGRNNDAGYVEFGSIQAVEALVRQVLRDLPAPATADSVQEDAARYRWLREGNDAKHGAAWHVAVNLYGCEWDAAIDAAMNKGGA